MNAMTAKMKMLALSTAKKKQSQDTAPHHKKMGGTDSLFQGDTALETMGETAPDLPVLRVWCSSEGGLQKPQKIQFFAPNVSLSWA
jgi:hypothetical protein